MRLRLRLDNLLDRDYENLIGFPAPGRSLRVGLTYTAQG
jgi:outer membrane cobalamin receptor